jgi:FSR family fosmidomycin resistance protein-like MFS transporter
MIFGLVIMALLFRIVPLPIGEGLKDLGFLSSIKEVLGAVWKSIVLIWVVMVLRAFVGQSFMTFIPVLFDKQGYSLISIGTIVSLFTISGAISGLLAGRLSDRFGYKLLFYTTHGLATPSLFLLILLPGRWVYLGVFLVFCNRYNFTL